MPASSARYDAMYACHTRNKEVEAVEAVEETVQVARDSGVRCQVSHIIPRRGGPPGARERAVGAVEKGHDEGLDVAFDAHTRLHGITNLSAALPSTFLEKSTAERRALLSDDAFRRHVRAYPSLIASFALGGWKNVYLFRSATSPEAVGKSIADLTSDGEDGWDTLMDILAREFEQIEYPMVLCHSYTEEELRDTFLPSALHRGLGRHGPRRGRTARRHRLPRRVQRGRRGSSRRFVREDEAIRTGRGHRETHHKAR